MNGDSRLSRRLPGILILCVSEILLSLVEVFTLAGAASAQGSSVSTASPVSAVPTPPPPRSPMNVWQAWAAQQRSEFKRPTGHAVLPRQGAPQVQ